MDGDLNQVTDPRITTVETIISNDDLESDAVGEVIEAETYSDDFEVRRLLISTANTTRLLLLLLCVRRLCVWGEK